MPKIAVHEGKTIYAYDIETEVLKPLKDGYYAEAYARLDSMLDTAIGASLEKAYPAECCRKLLKDLEKAMRKEYFAVSGLVKARVLMEKGAIPKALYAKITEFKGYRNRVVHDIEGPDSLGKEDVAKAVKLGIECFNELLKLK